MSTFPLRLASFGLATAFALLVVAPQGMVSPAMAQAQSQTANLSDAQRRCLAEASRVKRDYNRYFGGEHVFYDFGARSEEAEALCEHNDIDEAWDLMAEIKSDIRALRNQDNGRFKSN